MSGRFETREFVGEESFIGRELGEIHGELWSLKLRSVELRNKREALIRQLEGRKR